MEEKITLNKKTFKALTAENRLEILRMLSKRRYTLSEFSDILKLSNSTIKEHLNILQDAGLIKQVDEGRKWKYYKLTLKGKKVIAPDEVKVLFAFLISLAALPVSLFYFISKMKNQLPDKGTFAARTAAKEITEESATLATEMIGSGSHISAQYIPKIELAFVIIFTLLLLGSMIYLLSKKYGGKRK